MLSRTGFILMQNLLLFIVIHEAAQYIRENEHDTLTIELPHIAISGNTRTVNHTNSITFK